MPLDSCGNRKLFNTNVDFMIYSRNILLTFVMVALQCCGDPVGSGSMCFCVLRVAGWRCYWGFSF